MGGSTETVETMRAVALRRALLALEKEYAPTARKFCNLARIQSGTWSRYINGQQKPSVDKINEICDNLDVAAERRANLLSLIQGTDEQQWAATTLPEQRAMLAAYLDIEDSADEIEEANNDLIIGWGQTRAYTEEIMAKGEEIGEVPRGERVARVNMRVGRRDLLTRPNPANFRAFIGEAALAQVIGSPALMVDQLRYLLHLAKQPNISIRVLPFTCGFHPALQGSFIRLGTKTGTFIHVETQGTGMMLNAEPDLKRFERRFDAVAAAALEEEPSARLIAEYAERMERM